MYVTKIEVRNVKGLAHYVWELEESDSRPGWHVFLGDNGSGKSTLLKACALALLGPRNAGGLRLALQDWIRKGASEGNVMLAIEQDNRLDRWSGKGNTKVGALGFGIKLTPSGLDVSGADPYRHVWDSPGWFSASFGPFRRFSGGSKEYEKLFYSMPRLAAHLSIFGEDVALSETLAWLRDVHYAQLDEEKRGAANPRSKVFLDQLTCFINQDGFLPNGATLREITPKGVMFVDSNGADIRIEELSDGFRSILSLTLELIRLLTKSYPNENVFDEEASRIVLPGVVIIDEIDVHLHPRWQRTIGPWLTEHFPNLQFLVTTHSPLVCHGAIKGTITRLPDPGTSDGGGRVSGAVLNKILYGDILDALGSGAFGSGIERSAVAQSMFHELARLNVKARKGKLDAAAAARQKELRDIFSIPSGAEGEDIDA